MELDKFLNEYEFDWAAMPALNKEFSYTDLKGKTVAIISKKDCFLAKALLYSFLCVNDIKKAQLKVVWALLEENTENNLKELKKEREDFEIASFYKLQQAHICIYADVAGREEAVIDKQKEAFMAGFVQVCDRVAQIKPEQFLIGSDYRIYGKTVKGICLSEKELIESDCATAAFFRTLEEKGQKLLKKTETNITIFRTAQLYGPCGITWGRIYEMLLSLKEEKEIKLQPGSEKNSYLFLGDFLEAVHYLLLYPQKEQVFNLVSSVLTDFELVAILERCYPKRVHILMGEALNNYQEISGLRLSHYGWKSSIEMKDGLILTAEAMLHPKEVFVFPEIYQGKLYYIRSILLEMLQEIDRICKKHNIQYFLAGGTLLGAVRHKGFIPWDDDLDIMMVREDYEKFCKVAGEELDNRLFFQTSASDSQNHFFSKVRLKDTESVTPFTGKFMNMNNGLFIDIFPHDKTANSKIGQKLHRNITIVARSMVFNKWGNTKIAGDGSNKLMRGLFTIVKNVLSMKTLERFQYKTIRFFEKKKNAKYLYDGMGQNLRRGVFPASWLEEAVLMEFEGKQFPVPKEYDNYLRFLYGDYEKLPKASSRQMSHNILILDLGRYLEIELKKHRNEKI